MAPIKDEDKSNEEEDSDSDASGVEGSYSFGADEPDTKVVTSQVGWTKPFYQISESGSLLVGILTREL